MRCRALVSTAGSHARVDLLADQALTAFVTALRHSFLISLSRRVRRPLATLAAVPPLLRSHPALFLHTLAELLFVKQGYCVPTRAKRGRSRADAFLLPVVLLHGSGGPVALTVLFAEVARRAGLEVAIGALDSGAACVVWPRAVGGVPLGRDSLSVSGHRCVALDFGPLATGPVQTNLQPAPVMLAAASVTHTGSSSLTFHAVVQCILDDHVQAGDGAVCSRRAATGARST